MEQLLLTPMEGLIFTEEGMEDGFLGNAEGEGQEEERGESVTGM